MKPATSPMAFLITFRCYGTWLHGDARGSTNRFDNRFGTPHLPSNDRWEQQNLNSLKGAPVKLGSAERTILRQTIEETCEFRNWSLHAQNVRTNHVHIVVGTGETNGKKALAALKSNCTRSLKEAGMWTKDHSPWSKKGSIRYLWDIGALAEAVDYVLCRQ